MTAPSHAPPPVYHWYTRISGVRSMRTIGACLVMAAGMGILTVLQLFLSFLWKLPSFVFGQDQFVWSTFVHFVLSRSWFNVVRLLVCVVLISLDQQVHIMQVQRAVHRTSIAKYLWCMYPRNLAFIAVHAVCGADSLWSVAVMLDSRYATAPLWSQVTEGDVFTLLFFGAVLGMRYCVHGFFFKGHEQLRFPLLAQSITNRIPSALDLALVANSAAVAMTVTSISFVVTVILRIFSVDLLSFLVTGPKLSILFLGALQTEVLLRLRTRLFEIFHTQPIRFDFPTGQTLQPRSILNGIESPLPILRWMAFLDLTRITKLPTKRRRDLLMSLQRVTPSDTLEHRLGRGSNPPIQLWVTIVEECLYEIQGLTEALKAATDRFTSEIEEQIDHTPAPTASTFRFRERATRDSRKKADTGGGSKKPIGAVGEDRLREFIGRLIKIFRGRSPVSVNGASDTQMFGLSLWAMQIKDNVLRPSDNSIRDAPFQDLQLKVWAVEVVSQLVMALVEEEGHGPVKMMLQPIAQALLECHCHLALFLETTDRRIVFGLARGAGPAKRLSTLGGKEDGSEVGDGRFQSQALLIEMVLTNAMALFSNTSSMYIEDRTLREIKGVVEP